MTDAASPSSLPAVPASVPGEPGSVRRRLVDWTLPFLVLGAALYGWQTYVDRNAIPPYVLPSPSLILSTLISDWSTLGPSLLVTLTTTAEALALALIGSLAALLSP